MNAKAMAEKRAAREKERARRYREQARQLERGVGPENREVQAEINRLRSSASKAEASFEAARREAAGVKEELLNTWVNLLPLTDPRRGIARWRDDFPILLFPIRLETRFKKVQEPEGSDRDELWLRIYPDDCLVSTFEEDLTEMERRNARR